LYDKTPETNFHEVNEFTHLQNKPFGYLTRMGLGIPGSTTYDAVTMGGGEPKVNLPFFRFVMILSSLYQISFQEFRAALA